MTNTLKYSLFFFGGLILGGGAGYISAKMILEKRYDERYTKYIEEMEEYYQKTDTYRRNSDSIVDDSAEVNPIGNTDRSQGILSEQARNEIKEKLIKNYETTSNYATIYKEAHPDIFAENGKTSSESTEEKALDEEELNEAEKATLEHMKHKNDPPKIITSDEYDALPPNIDTATLYFYHDDETLVDDNDDVIEDPAVLIGNALNDSDFIDNIGEPMMFVYNPALDTAYEIQRVEGTYYDG